jgi:hypothetical protein
MKLFIVQFCQSSVTLFILGPSILLSTMFSNTVTLAFTFTAETRYDNYATSGYNYKTIKDHEPNGSKHFRKLICISFNHEVSFVKSLAPVTILVSLHATVRMLSQ